jgi:hypothetical protein
MKTNFSSLKEGIKCLQKNGAMLDDSLTLVKKKMIWRRCQGTLGKMVLIKTECILNKNSGYETVCSFSRILTGEPFSTKHKKIKKKKKISSLFWGITFSQPPL